MRKHVWLAALAALVWVPAARAEVGGAGRMFPPRLLEAQQKQWEAFVQQVQKDAAEYDAKVAPLAEQLQETVTLLSDDIKSTARDLTAQHNETLRWLELRRTEFWQYLAGSARELLQRSAEKEAAEEGVPPPLK
jgi:hypothetical protein